MSIRFWLGLLRPVPRPAAGLVETIVGPDDIDEPVAATLAPEDVQRLRDGLEAWDPNRAPIAEEGGPAVEILDEEDRVDPEPVVPLNVAPERRPWDTARLVQSPVAPIMPLPRDRESACIDQDADRRCDAGDALTAQITALKALEARVAELERQVSLLRVKGRQS